MINDKQYVAIYKINKTNIYKCVLGKVCMVDLILFCNAVPLLFN
uniref:RH29885p n=1 Tax=Drosophila melanogaster TaxID=7227 RepID=Q8IGG0_DROME|nr:RH29885p [Drosophila melanogaster]